ncbi:hypothetical protein E4U41_002471 [Claviceps citrina]|nr:hypothetical protein E4U41_002471 [Claviceps citrina]
MPKPHGKDARGRHTRTRSRSPRPPTYSHRHGSSTTTTTTRHGRSASPDSRSRSRRPHDHDHDHDHDQHHRRRHHHHHHRSKSRERPSGAAAAVSLPFSARRLGKSDYRSFEPLFAHYLDLQKQRDLGCMDEREVRGRWKSFAGKWNRGELAEGWYDPDMFARCAAEYASLAEEEGWDDSASPRGGRGGGGGGGGGQTTGAGSARMNSDEGDDDDDDDDDDAYVPILPGQKGPKARLGAKSATTQDLSLRDELLQEQRETERHQLRQARRADRALQKERLEELVPRAEPGTRERKLEKKKEVNETMRQFRDRSPAPGLEVGDAQLLGTGDGLDEHKRMRARERTRKSDRQVRREEFERAKREEMEHRQKLWREREEGTVSMLRELARQRFG